MQQPWQPMGACLGQFTRQYGSDVQTSCTAHVLKDTEGTEQHGQQYDVSSRSVSRCQRFVIRPFFTQWLFTQSDPIELNLICLRPLLLFEGT